MAYYITNQKMGVRKIMTWINNNSGHFLFKTFKSLYMGENMTRVNK